MGLLDATNQNTYYNVTDPKGDYQFTTLDNIINAFMFSYVGENKIITKVNRTDVQFHGMRAIQELSYDVFRSVKSQEIEVPPSLTMALPQDYINYVKLVVIGSDGIEKNLYPTGKTSNPFAITQDSNGVYQFTDADNDGALDTLTEQNPSDTWTNYQAQESEPSINASDSADVEIDFAGRRYGLDPQHSHMHGSFYIDYLRGFIHFSSAVAGKTVTLKYISDGLGTDSEMVVHKFAEEAVYKHIVYGVISVRSNIPEYIVQRFKKERFAETRKAKIRLSNIKIEEFTQVLKGMGKQIK
mgnify:CR=1 FL=1|jgi:hypothetical protein|tara:strand:+ start:82 stop:975 length:894 start_codon:yes stop_codon:yes gene_type:complete